MTPKTTTQPPMMPPATGPMLDFLEESLLSPVLLSEEPLPPEEPLPSDDGSFDELVSFSKLTGLARNILFTSSESHSTLSSPLIRSACHSHSR